MKVQHYKAEEKQTTVAPFKCPHASMCVLHIIARLSVHFISYRPVYSAF